MRNIDEEENLADIPQESEMSVGPEAPEMMRGKEDDLIQPFPPGVAMQEAYDDMLQNRIVDPLYKAGYENLGAGLGAVSSAAHEMLVPQTNLDVAGTIVPLPGVAKLMKKGKFRKIRNAMKAEGPEEVGEIIAKQAGKAADKEDVIDDLYFKLNRMSRDDPEFVKIQDKIDDLSGKPPRPERPKAEVRSIDEKEMLRKADEANAKEDLRDERRRFKQESDFFDKHGFSEKEIEKQIAKKYGLKGDNHFWSMVDDEAESYLGTSDASGKEGYVIDITNGDKTISVLHDEYMDIMGLSGAIPIDETPFVQAMKTKKPKADPSLKDRQDALKANLERKRIEREDEQFGEKGLAIKESLTKIGQLMKELKGLPGSVEPPKVEPPKNPLKLAEPPKPPKGTPEASSSRFPGIQSQMDQRKPADKLLPGGVSEQNQGRALWDQSVKNHEERLKTSYPNRGKKYLTPGELDEVDNLYFELNRMDRKDPNFNVIQERINKLLGLKS